MARIQSKTTTMRATTRTKTASVARPLRPQSNAQKVEELKLGKFDKCKPLRMPEKEVRRGWQIVGAVSLMLAAMVGLYILLVTEPVKTWLNPDGFGDPLFRLPVYWLVMEAMVVLFTLDCLVMSIMLLVRKRVPALLWQILIATATIVALCASFHVFTYYEARDCYMNYPGIKTPSKPNVGSSCPSVRDDLILISLRNLVIYTIGIIIGVVVYRVTRHHVQCMSKSRKPKRK